MQDTGETRNEFEDITNKILHELFNFKIKMKQIMKKKNLIMMEKMILYIKI